MAPGIILSALGLFRFSIFDSQSHSQSQSQSLDNNSWIGNHRIITTELRLLESQIWHKQIIFPSLSQTLTTQSGQLLSFEKLSHSQIKTPHIHTHNCVKDKAFHLSLKRSKGSWCIAELNSIVSKCCHSSGSTLVMTCHTLLSHYIVTFNKRPSSYPTWPDQAQWSGWTFRGHCARVSLQQPASVWVARPVSTGCPKKTLCCLKFWVRVDSSSIQMRFSQRCM